MKSEKSEDEKLHEFMEAWELDLGEKLTEGEARIELARLRVLYQALLKPLPCELDLMDEEDQEEKAA